MDSSHQFSDELDWLVPGAVLTGGLAAFSLYEMPQHDGVIPALLLLPLWMLLSLSLAGVDPAFRMMRDGVEHPISHCLMLLRQNWRFLVFLVFSMVLTGLNMITFMWVKPLLNYLVPFWADPMLAEIDRTLFRVDPWRALSWLDVTPLVYFYHRAWFALMIIVLLKVVKSPPSPLKSSILLTYFILWSVFGPLVHILLPAAGPVFYGKLGYGGAFSGLAMEPETRKLADYLWTIYSHQTFGAGAGISAMPSLHIATTAWMVIAVRQFASRWSLLMCAAGILIFFLSISLGWHYAIDGLIGAAGAYAIWRLSLAVLTARTTSTSAAMRSA